MMRKLSSFDLLWLRTFVVENFHFGGFHIVYGIRKKKSPMHLSAFIHCERHLGFTRICKIPHRKKTKRSRKRKTLEITRKAKLLGQSAEVLSFQIMMKRAEECHTLTNVSREDKKAKQ